MNDSEKIELSLNQSQNSTNHFTTKEKNEKNKKDEDNTQKLIEIISELLSTICEEGKRNSDNKNLLIQYFLFKEIPRYSIKDYLIRLIKYTNINDSTIVIILIYIDRICNLNNINLNYYNIHKLILASFVTAIKFNEEKYNSIDFYSKLGGISKKEMSQLEYVFLVLINYNLFVNTELFDKYQENLFDLDNEDNEEKNEENIDDKIKKKKDNHENKND